MTTPTLITAYDPGTTTGVAWYDVEKKEFGSDQFGETSLYMWVEAMGSKILHAQVEAFTITQATAKKTVVYDSLYLIGFLRYAGWLYEFPLSFTKPADVMATFPDDALKLKGWHTPGRGHANDAARHLAWFVVKSKLMSGSEFLPRG